MHQNFINAISEACFVLPAEGAPQEEKNLQEVDCKTPQASDMTIDLDSRDDFSYMDGHNRNMSNVCFKFSWPG